MQRRTFLRGVGGLALAIPFLPSLQQKNSWASVSTRPVRYVQWVTDHGVHPDSFWPTVELGEPDSRGVRQTSLADVEGSLSTILGQPFDGLKDDLLLCNGLDLLVVRHFHNACVPTCASWPREDNHIPFFAHSVDTVLEASNKVYPTPTRMGALRLTPGVNSSYKWGSFSWTTVDGRATKLPCYDSNAAALNALFGSTDTSAGAAQQLQEARVLLVDRVLDDYRSVVATASSADKRQLEHYLDLLSELQTRVSVEVKACGVPTLPQELDFDVLHRNAIDLAVAALLCDATRVVAYHSYHGAPDAYDEETFHAWAHDNRTLHTQMQAYRYKQLAALIERLKSVQEDGGDGPRALLDNCLVYANNELSDPPHGSSHLRNMPVILAGKAGGRLNPGRYVHFGGRLMNSLLVSIFDTMGLAPEDFERNGVAGFGDYEGNNAELYSQFLSQDERRQRLPVV